LKRVAKSRAGESIDVCICTYRRPQVVQTLRSIAAQQDLDGVRVRVIVADNDATPSAERLTREAAAELGLTLTYIHAPEQNISVARNACLAAAQADWIAFLDDDETADPLWLARLLATAGVGGWDAVLGPVLALYRPEAKPWVRQGDFHSILRPVRVRGVILTGYTCNVLMRREAVGPVTFRVEFGRSGGEDLDFFYRFTDRGGRIGFAPDAVVFDPVPAERERFAWLARRWYRSGQSHAMRLLSRMRSPAGRAQAALLASTKAAVYALGMLALLPFGVQRRRNALGMALHAGVVSRLLGVRLLEIYGHSPAPRAGGPTLAASPKHAA
jgi:succinoglycan biosynthesis protein ExoM